MAGTTASVTAVQASLAQAGDGQIARVVAMVDALRQRGQADALLEPLRARLARIRPARPLSFRRLMFTPVDPLIVPGGRWQRGGPNVPRSALVPIAVSIEARLPRELHGVEAPDRSAEALAASGGPLWQAAAAAVDPSAVPPDWSQVTKLPEADYAPIAEAVAAVLTCASALLKLEGCPAPSSDQLANVLTLARARGPHGLAAVTAILLARMPQHDQVLAAVAAVGAAAAPAVIIKAAEHALDLMEAAVAEAGERDATAVVQASMRVASLLESLAPAIGQQPECRGRMEALRQQAEAVCQAEFDQGVQRFLGGIQGAEPAGAAAMEDGARNLRRLEFVGAKLGNGAHYSAALKNVMASQGACLNQLDTMDQIRLVEIIAGPERAMELLMKTRTSRV